LPLFIFPCSCVNHESYTWPLLAPLEGRLVGTAALSKPERPVYPALSQSRPKWLVAASGKGGTTKTTTSLNLATVAAASGLTVGLLDTDEQRTLTKWHIRRSQVGYNLPSIQIFSIPLVDIARGLKTVDDTEGLDLIIVDTPPGLDQHSKIRTLLARADFVLVPTTQSTADTDSAIEFMLVVASLKVKAAFLLSRTNQRWSSHRTARRLLNRVAPLCPIDIRQLRDIEATHDHGLGVNEFGGAKGVEDVEAVWDYIRKELGL